MAFEVSKVVTDRTADGKSVFAEEKSVEPAPVLGLDIFNIWGTADGAPSVGAGDNPATVPFPFFPGPGGSRFIVVRFPPDSAAAEPGNADPEEAAAQAERTQPGLIGVFEPDTPGMHTTDSVDYGVCVEGEVYLELDDGAEAHVTPGNLRGAAGHPARLAEPQRLALHDGLRPHRRGAYDRLTATGVPARLLRIRDRGPARPGRRLRSRRSAAGVREQLVGLPPRDRVPPRRGRSDQRGRGEDAHGFGDRGAAGDSDRGLQRAQRLPAGGGGRGRERTARLVDRGGEDRLHLVRVLQHPERLRRHAGRPQRLRPGAERGRDLLADPGPVPRHASRTG